jgi:predicted RNA-binding Zn ribbon-like protein
MIRLTGYRDKVLTLASGDPMPETTRVLALVGGRLAINFANAPSFPAAPLTEFSWEELVLFLEASQIVSHEKGQTLLGLAQADLQTVDAALSRAVRLRDVLRLSFAAIVRKERVSRQWVEPINEILRVTEGHNELVYDQGAWKLEFIAREGGLDWLLAAIARSAAEILVEGPAARIRMCANPDCGLLFCDNSRTHRRRWCSMAVCGNRHKVASFARRHAS